MKAKFSQKIKNPPKLPTENKKVCQFCANNEYEGKYSDHLNRKHKEIINNRLFLKNISKHLSTEQLATVKAFIIRIKGNKKD